MEASLEVRWRSIPPDALTWRDWGADVLVFNQDTGSTHLLGVFAAEVLRQLTSSDAGVTVGMLATELSAGECASRESIAAIEDTLLEFARLGLARHERS